jgi:hypothetical protein
MEILMRNNFPSLPVSTGRKAFHVLIMLIMVMIVIFPYFLIQEESADIEPENSTGFESMNLFFYRMN